MCIISQQSSTSTDPGTAKTHAGISIGCTAFGVISSVVGVAIIIGVVAAAINSANNNFNNDF